MSGPDNLQKYKNSSPAGHTNVKKADCASSSWPHPGKHSAPIDGSFCNLPGTSGPENAHGKVKFTSLTYSCCPNAGGNCAEKTWHSEGAPGQLMVKKDGDSCQMPDGSSGTAKVLKVEFSCCPQ